MNVATKPKNRGGIAVCVRFILSVLVDAFAGATPGALIGTIIGLIASASMFFAGGSTVAMRGSLEFDAAAGAIAGASLVASAGLLAAILRQDSEGLLSRFKNFMLFVTGVEILALGVSLLGGVPGALVGALVGRYFAATIYGATIGYLLLGVPCALRVVYWYWQGKKLQQQGYLAPYPTTIERVLYVWLCRQILSLTMGPVKTYGMERINFDGRFIYGGNHQSGRDFLIARLAVPFSYRQITQFRQLKGLNSGVGAFSGAFGVPSAGGKSYGNSDAVIEGGADMLCRHEQAKLLLYFQGKLIPELNLPAPERTNENALRYEDFRTGAIRMLQRVVEKVAGESPAARAEAMKRVGILPKAIHYPPNFRKQGWFSGRLARLWLAFDHVSTPTYGAVVVVGKVIPLSDMPQDPVSGKVDPRGGINMVRDSIARLLSEAKAMAEPGADRLRANLARASVDGEHIARLFEHGLFCGEKLEAATAGDIERAGLTSAQAAAVKRLYTTR
jgi:hypothetical protein